MRIDASRFVGLIRMVVQEELPLAYALGTIPSDYASGLPKVRFDNESTASTKLRPHLSSYAPAADDRVLMARVGNGWVILGKVTA